MGFRRLGTLVPNDSIWQNLKTLEYVLVGPFYTKNMAYRVMYNFIGVHNVKTEWVTLKELLANYTKMSFKIIKE